LIAGVPAVAVTAAAVFGVVLPRVKRARQRQMGITLASFSDASIVAPPRPTRPPTPESVATAAPAQPARPAPPESPYAPPRREAATGTTGWAESIVEPPRLRLETTAERPPVAPEGKPLGRRSPRPIDGTLQFLPGRFEVLEGREIGQEIRFVRQPGAAKTEVTFGRQDGIPYQHVQLHEPTVSRLHAKMTLEDQDWRLTNLSATNPVSVNGAPLGADHGSVLLRDGDRVELGEVVFRFRAK
jgi:FHA domain-containing protein